MICHLCRDTTDRCNCVTRGTSSSRVARAGLAAAALACVSACATPTLELALGANVTAASIPVAVMQRAQRVLAVR